MHSSYSLFPQSETWSGDETICQGAFFFLPGLPRGVGLFGRDKPKLTMDYVERR